MELIVLLNFTQVTDRIYVPVLFEIKSAKRVRCYFQDIPSDLWVLLRMIGGDRAEIINSEKYI